MSTIGDDNCTIIIKKKLKLNPWTNDKKIRSKTSIKKQVSKELNKNKNKEEGKKKKQRYKRSERGKK